MQTEIPSLAEVIQGVRDTAGGHECERERRAAQRKDSFLTTSSSRGGKDDKTLMDPAEAAKYLGVAVGTLSVWRSVGRYALPFVKVGRRVKYRRSDLDAWLELRTRTSGATA